MAPNGAYKNKTDHPFLPITDDEIIKECITVQNIGVNMMHLHIRDNRQQHSINSYHYQQLIKNIQAKLNKPMVLQVTSESAGIFKAPEQIKMIQDLKPEFVSIAWREICPIETQKLSQFFKWLRDNNINPQIILYDIDDVRLFLSTLRIGDLFFKDLPVLLVAGKRDLDFKMTEFKKMIKKCQQNNLKSIMLCGFKEYETKITQIALQQNLHLRVGFENNLYLKNGKLAQNNMELIKETINTFENHKIADYETTKKLLTPEMINYE